MNTSFFLFNPIFQYDNIVEKYEGNPHGNVSADKFKTDMEFSYEIASCKTLKESIK